MVGGLSPRVRGNRGREWRGCVSLGSIPASAGEPHSDGVRGTYQTVYPRECGGTWKALGLVCCTMGLSPRVRGTHRVTGEQHYKAGLSPRVRGNHRVRRHQEAEGRSIPASAGEPRLEDIGSRWTRVYPRECGGTRLEFLEDAHGEGLSPRVRGNRPGPKIRCKEPGSIPASAGEPEPESRKRRP